MSTNYSHIARLQKAIYIQLCKCFTETRPGRRQRTKERWQNTQLSLWYILSIPIDAFHLQVKTGSMNRNDKEDTISTKSENPFTCPYPVKYPCHLGQGSPRK